MQYHHGLPRRGPWFEGVYFKHRGPVEGIALIPAIHRSAEGQCSASLQIITEEGSYVVEYPAADFSARRDRLMLTLGENTFSSQGVKIKLAEEGIEVEGRIDYGPLTPLGYHIMGPFQLVEPVMECYHSVFSLGHTLTGSLRVNGRTVDFDAGQGYLEGDRGRSFPRDYLWTQCGWADSSIVLCVAEIPFLGGRFKGCLGVVRYRGEEHRLATYLGGRIRSYGPHGAELHQGRYRLVVELLSQAPHPLRAPREGAMERIVHESLSARVRYRLWRGRELLLDHTSNRASYECAGASVHSI